MKMKQSNFVMVSLTTLALLALLGGGVARFGAAPSGWHVEPCPE